VSWEKGMSHATVKDIAKLAGVSTATVSRVINASSTVSPSARTAVITAIDQLHYTRNRNASELALIAAFKRRRGSMRVVLPAASDRLNKRPRDLSLMRGPDVNARDAGAGEIPGIDDQIRALRESFKQIEARLSRIEYALAQPGAKARR
jgi:DNA-binding LacI/PurR family transcriptional regulator